MAHHVTSCSHAYNVFRRATAPDLLCVVRSDYVIPSFIHDEWEFVEAPTPFSAAAADDGMRYNGFYLVLSLPLPRMECGFRLAA